MGEVVNIYYLIIDQLLCLNVWMDSKTVKLNEESHRSIRESDAENKCGRKVDIKNGCMDVTAVQCSYVYKAPEDWCELQDKILRVLTYKYYGSDFALSCNNYGITNIKDNDSFPKYFFEEEMEVCNLQEYADMTLPTIEVQLAHEFLPIQMNPQNIIIEDDRFWARAWKLIKNTFTFKSCRE